LIYTAWSMPTSSRIRAFSMCWAMRVLACWNGANNSRTSWRMSIFRWRSSVMRATAMCER
jgi:Predicted ATPase or kinase